MNKSLLKIQKSFAALSIILLFSLSSWGQSAFNYKTPSSRFNEPGYSESGLLESEVANSNLSNVNSIDEENFDKSSSQNEKVKIYPNPSDGIFTIEINKTEGNKVSVEILDITGKLVYRNDYPVVGSLKESIDLQNLNKGMYFLRVKEGEKISTVKIILR